MKAIWVYTTFCIVCLSMGLIYQCRAITNLEQLISESKENLEVQNIRLTYHYERLNHCDKLITNLDKSTADLARVQQILLQRQRGIILN